jgi:hypothetical protein
MTRNRNIACARPLGLQLTGEYDVRANLVKLTGSRPLGAILISYEAHCNEIWPQPTSLGSQIVGLRVSQGRNALLYHIEAHLGR